MQRSTMVQDQGKFGEDALLDDYEEKIVQFRRFVINHPLHVITNMDKTPLIFDMRPNRIINNTGEKAIKICTTGTKTIVLQSC